MLDVSGGGNLRLNDLGFYFSGVGGTTLGYVVAGAVFGSAAGPVGSLFGASAGIGILVLIVLKLNDLYIINHKKLIKLCFSRIISSFVIVKIVIEFHVNMWYTVLRGGEIICVNIRILLCLFLRNLFKG